MKKSNFLVYALACAFALLCSATPSAAQTVLPELPTGTQEIADPQKVAQSGEATVEDELLPEATSSAAENSASTDASLFDLVTSEPEKLKTSRMVCHQFPGCSYVFNSSTMCCEETTGGLCPEGRCL